MTLLTIDQWKNDVQGRRIVWGQNGPQCVDLAKDKAIRVDGAPKGAYGHGKDMAQGLSRLDEWTYHRFGNTNPCDGAIVSAEPVEPWHPDYGHVFVFHKVNADRSWTITDQNPRPATTRRIMPTALRGFVQPPEKAVVVSDGATGLRYTIKSGDTLANIANKFEVEIDQLKTWNGIRDVNVISAGQTITVSEPVVRYRVVWQRANLFTGPSDTKSSKLGQLTEGYADLTATGRKANGWIEVASRYMRQHGQTGWIWGDAVRVAD